MRVLHVSEHVWPVGGCERMLGDTCRLLAAAGHDVCVVVAEDTETRDFPFAVERLPRSLGFRSGERALRALDALLDRHRPDVAHLHNARDFLGPRVVAGLARRVPTLRYVHDARLFCPQVRSKWLMRQDAPCPHPMGVPCLLHCFPIDAGGGRWRGPVELAWWYGDLSVTRGLPAVAVGSGYMREQLLVNGLDPARLHVLPGFTDKARGDADSAPAELSQPERQPEPHVLAIGRFDQAKGLETLPRLLATITGPFWQATIVGEGRHRDATRAAAEALGLGVRFRFPGAVAHDALDPLYRSARVVVVPSQVPEAFGLVGIEAMAFGRPVVGYDIGGIGEWLKDGVNGFLVAPGDEAGFARRVEQLLRDDALAARLGRGGRESVERRFRPEAHLRQLLQVYASIAGRAVAGDAPADHGAAETAR